MNRPAIIGLALFALAWIQVSAASHRFEHYAGEATDICGVCLQIKQAEEQLQPVTPSFLPAEKPAGQALHLPTSRDACPWRVFFPRAPPSTRY